MNHITENKLIKETQYGFVPGKSCPTNLTLFMDKVTKVVDIFYLNKELAVKIKKKMAGEGGGKLCYYFPFWPYLSPKRSL
jgi:hypothetical protein